MKKKLSFFLILVMLTTVISFAGSGSNTYAAPSSIVTNGSFESNLTGWSWWNNGGAQGNVVVMADGGYDGTKYVRITNNSSMAPNVFVTLQQNLTVRPYTKYIISMRARTNNTNDTWFGGNPGWTERFSFSKTSNGQWTRYEATIVTGSETVWPFMVVCGDVTTQLDIDYISLKEANQVDNYGFESNLTNWTTYTSGGAQATFTIRTDGAYEGSKYLRITNSSGSAPNVYGCLTQNIPVEPYSSYVITIRARTSGANNCWFGGNPIWSTKFSLDLNSFGEWKEYKKTIVTGAETTWPFVFITENTTTALDIDKIQIEKVPVPGLTSSVMANGSFEDDKIGWTTLIAGGAQGSANVITGAGYDGNKCILIQNNSPQAPNVFVALQQNLTVKPYTKYIISIRAQTTSANNCWYGGGPTWSTRIPFNTTTVAIGGWIKYEATIVTGSETTWPFLVLSENTTAQLLIDSISFKEANQIENYSFERDLINWTTYTSGGAQATFTVRTDGPYDGSKYLRITNTSTLLAGRYGCLTQNIPVEPYSSYVITLRARTTGANNCWFGGDQNWGTRFPLDVNYSGWKEYKKTIVTGPETVYPFVVITENTTTALDIDKIQIEKVEATYPGLHGKNIWYSAADDAGRAERYFRKTFSITTLPKRAMLVVNADYASKVYVNGSVVNSTMGRFVPKAYDVTRYLTTGTNIVAIQVRTQGPSDYVTDTNFWSKTLDETLQKSERFLVADLDFDEANGTKVDKIHTDTTWKTKNTLVSGWTTVAFNDSTWANAVDLGYYGEPWNKFFFGWPTDEEMEFSGLEFTTPPAADYFTVGSAKTLSLRLSALKFRDTITSANLNYTVKNNQGTVVQSGSVTGLTFTNGIRDTSISLTPNIVGNYTIEFSSTIYTGIDQRATYVRNMVLGGNKLSFLINSAPVDVASSFSGICSQSIFINAPLENKQGFGMSRIGIYWHNMQPVENGTIYWAALDNAVNTAVANNVKPIILLGYGTTWASTAPVGTPDGDKPFYRPDTAKWETFLTAIVNRYKDRVKNWEVWNEANWGAWKSPAAEYVTHLRTTYNKIKSLDSSAYVILAGTASVYWDDPVYLEPDEWVNMVYANGGRGYFDAIAIHPYRQPNGPETYLTGDINSIKTVAANNSDAGRAIWITEIGQNTSGEGNGDGANEEAQARYFVRYSVMSVANGIQKVITYADWGGFYNDSSWGEMCFGITNYIDWSPKKAAQSATVMNQYLNGATYNSKIDLGNSNLYDYKFTKGTSERYVLWTPGNDTNVSINFGATSITKVDMYGGTQTLTSGNGIYTLTLSKSPIYIIK